MCEAPGSTQEKRRILIIDGHRLLRRGLAALIDAEPDLVVCAEAATRREALAALAATDPALVIVDYGFEPGLGLDLVRDICARRRDLPVLMMAMDATRVCAARAGESGAVGCISKQALNGKALAAIRAAIDDAFRRRGDNRSED